MTINNQEFTQLPKSVEKEWEKGLLSHPDLIHELSYEIENYYPYCMLMDKKRSLVAFKNRQYKILEKVKGRGNKIWYKFDFKDFSLLSKTDPDTIEGIEYERFYLQEPFQPCFNKPRFVEYMSTLMEIERRLKEPSPFMFRYAFIVKSAYKTDEYKRKMNELGNKIRILKQKSKWVEKEYKKAKRKSK